MGKGQKWQGSLILIQKWASWFRKEWNCCVYLILMRSWGPSLHFCLKGELDYGGTLWARPQLFFKITFVTAQQCLNSTLPKLQNSLAQSIGEIILPRTLSAHVFSISVFKYTLSLSTYYVAGWSEGQIWYPVPIFEYLLHRTPTLPPPWFLEIVRGLLNLSGWEKFGKRSVEQGSDVWVFDSNGISVG